MKYRKRLSDVTAIKWDGKLNHLFDALEGAFKSMDLVHAKFSVLPSLDLFISRGLVGESCPLGTWLVFDENQNISKMSYEEFYKGYEQEPIEDAK